MTAPGRYAASDGSFAKSAGSAAARGGVLIAIAVVIGFVLLRWGFDGGEPDAAGAAGGGGDTPETTAPDDGSDPTETTVPDDGSDPTETTVPDDGGGEGTPTTAPVTPDDPSSVTVMVLNATGEPGLARTRAEALGALGYVWTAGNAAASPLTDSKVYFVTGFGDEAGVVVQALSGPASVLELAPDDPTTLATDQYADDVAAADIIVVLGTDNALQ